MVTANRKSAACTIQSGDSSSDISIPRYELMPIAGAVIAALTPSHATLAQDNNSDKASIEEIIVTATKRDVSMQDVPQSITAFGTADIEKMVFKNMEDYMKAIPSASLVNSMPGRNSISMRGVTTGSQEYRTESQVALYLDEMPISAISQQPEVAMVDIARVEALPGPQGTLFGASSQSGTLRIITNKPNHDGFSGQVDATVGTTDGGDESYDFNGHLNIPLIDEKLAVRLVGYTSRDGGYVDNVLGATYAGPGAFGSPGDNSAIAKDNQNVYEVSGGRIAALWTINDKWSMDIGAVVQNSTADGTWESDPYLGDYKITRFFDEYRNDDYWLTSMTLKGDLGFAEFVSTTTYYERDSSYEWDNMQYNQWQTSYYGPYFAPYDFQYEFGTIFNIQVQERFAQEFRLTSTSDSKLQWMVGAYYDDVYDAWDYGAQIPTLTQTNGWAAANAYACYYAANGYDVACPLPATTKTYVNDYDKTIKQKAVFGELVYHLNDDWTFTGGARWFQYDRTDDQVYEAPQGLPPIGSFGRGEGVFSSAGKSDDTIFKVSTQYNLNDESMVYALYSEGFRLGGNNSPKAVATGSIPATYGPDKLKNTEIGLKSEWFDNSLRVNLTYFQMKWEDIQLNARVDGPWWLRGTFNGNRLESNGVEITTKWQVNENLLIDVSALFNQSEYPVQTLDPRGNVYLEAGQAAPNSPETKYRYSVDYTLPRIDGLKGDIWFRYDTTYQGRSWDNLDAAVDLDPNGIIPAWRTSNLQAGVLLDNEWAVTLMARNVWNDTGVNSLYYSSYSSDWFGDPRWRYVRTIQRPRTISLTVRKRF